MSKNSKNAKSQVDLKKSQGGASKSSGLIVWNQLEKREKKWVKSQALNVEKVSPAEYMKKSRCHYQLTQNKKNVLVGCRITIPHNKGFVNEGKKIHAYHVQAAILYGDAMMDRVFPKNQHAKKKVKSPLSISHLCGSPGSECSNPRHLVIELKTINEERKHCHFCFLSSRQKSQRNRLSQRQFRRKVCPHRPRCLKALSKREADELRTAP